MDLARHTRLSAIKLEDLQHIRIAMNCRRAIDLASKIENYIACFITKRSNVKKIPKRGSILPIIEKQLDTFFTIIDTRLETSHRRAVGSRALQEATIAWNNLSTTIACYINEAVRSIEDCIIRNSGLI